MWCLVFLFTRKRQARLSIGLNAITINKNRQSIGMYRIEDNY